MIKVFLAHGIDSGPDRGKGTRDYFVKLIKECGCEVVGAGVAGNPIVAVDSSVGVCKAIIRHDLLEVSQAHVTLVVEDGVPKVGTWIEAWEAYKLGQYVLVFGKTNSVFLKGIADEITTSVIHLRRVLKSLGGI